MKTIYFFIAALIFLSAPDITLAQKQPYNTAEYIEWSEGNELSWEYFQGKPLSNSHGDAGASVKIKAKPYKLKGQIHYDVYALFNLKKSWSKKKSKQLLAHEQLHFDIAELTARQVRRKIQLLQKDKVNDLSSYNKAIRKILLESNKLDQRYDKETLHGILENKQKMWEEKIEQQLLHLKAYSRKGDIAETNF